MFAALTYVIKLSVRLYNKIINCTTFQVNSVEMNGAERTIAQVEHKWLYLKSAAKQSVAKWKRDCRKTGGGCNAEPQLSDTHYRVIAIIGEHSMAGVESASSLGVAMS